jgi:ribulose-phosphate 3-epimerase
LVGVSGRLPFTVAPSVLAGNVGDLAGEAVRCGAAGNVRWLHVDVCDGVFIPGRLTVGPAAVASLAQALEGTGVGVDCHVAVADPGRYVEALSRTGCGRLTFQWEGLSPLRSERTGAAFALAAAVTNAGMACGVCLAPSTRPEEVKRFLASGLVDLVSVLAPPSPPSSSLGGHGGGGAGGGGSCRPCTSAPGAEAQELDAATLSRVAALAAAHPSLPFICVDGGVEDAASCAAASRAGANMVVATRGIFRCDVKSAVQRLESAAHAATAEAAAAGSPSPSTEATLPPRSSRAKRGDAWVGAAGAR